MCLPVQRRNCVKSIILPVFFWRRYQQPQAQKGTPWILRSAHSITQLPEAGLECTDLRAEAFQLGPTAQDGAANWEGSPRGREVDYRRERESGEAWPSARGQTLHPPSGVRAPVRPPRREGVSGASELGTAELQPQIRGPPPRL